MIDAQQPFEPLMCRRLQQLRFQAAQPDAVPHQIDDIAHPDLFYEIGRGDIGGNPLQDHVIIGLVLAIDQRPRPEQRPARRTGGRRRRRERRAGCSESGGWGRRDRGHPRGRGD